MHLPNTAKNELRDILKKDIGDMVDGWSDEELNSFGDLLLTTLAESLKIRARQQNG